MGGAEQGDEQGRGLGSGVRAWKVRAMQNTDHSTENRLRCGSGRQRAGVGVGVGLWGRWGWGGAVQDVDHPSLPAQLLSNCGSGGGRPAEKDGAGRVGRCRQPGSVRSRAGSSGGGMAVAPGIRAGSRGGAVGVGSEVLWGGDCAAASCSLL